MSKKEYSTFIQGSQNYLMTILYSTNDSSKTW